MYTGNTKLQRSSLGDGQIRMMHLRQTDRELHGHTFFELVYIIGGTATHWMEQTSAPLRAGDYFIMDPGSKHCYRDTRELELVNCLFLPEYIDRALGDCPSLSSLLSNRVMRFGVPVDVKTADRIFHDTDGTVGRLIRQMEQEYDAGKSGYMELLRCDLTHVLVCAVRASEEQESARVQHSATTAIADYLRQNYAQPQSLTGISQRFGYTPQYLSSLFHRDTGMTIQTFLQRLRIEEACRLMGESGRTLTELAQAVGYTDAKHFSKIFRQHKGMSPREYRSSL